MLIHFLQYKITAISFETSVSQAQQGSVVDVILLCFMLAIVTQATGSMSNENVLS